jgi:DNA-binding transcriptional LysR family regulator
VQQFYISQPSLTNAIRELEQEVRLALSKTESSVVSQTLLEYLRSSRQRKDTPQIK